jgi:hypothetical protein
MLNASQAKALAGQWASESDRLYRDRAEVAIRAAAEAGLRAVELVAMEPPPSPAVRRWLVALGYGVEEPKASGCYARVTW